MPLQRPLPPAAFTTAIIWGQVGYGWGPAIGVGFGGVYVDTGLNGCLQQRWVETRRGMRLRTVNVCAY